MLLVTNDNSFILSSDTFVSLFGISLTEWCKTLWVVQGSNVTINVPFEYFEQLL